MSWMTAIWFGASLDQTLNTARLLVKGNVGRACRISATLAGFMLAFGLVSL